MKNDKKAQKDGKTKKPNKKAEGQKPDSSSLTTMNQKKPAKKTKLCESLLDYVY